MSGPAVVADPLQEVRTLLRAVFLGAEGLEVHREAGRLFDALSGRVLAPVPAASDGAGEVLGNDTPERLPYQHDLTGQDGEVYATIEVEADPAGHPLPLGLTLHRAVLLEAHAGGDEADVTLPLTLGEAQALGERLVEGARAGREQGSPA